MVGFEPEGTEGCPFLVRNWVRRVHVPSADTLLELVPF